MKKLNFVKALWSPFKPFKLVWYCGKTRIGTPYFLPRKWVKATPERAKKAALDEIQRIKDYNERNANNGSKPREPRTFEEYYKEYLRYEFPVSKKIGFDFVDLGWKTKWTDTDYRFEWAPRISFVFFGYQLAVTAIAPEQDHYWEAWLYYERNSDRSKSNKDRISQCVKEFPITYTKYLSNGSKQTINYYDVILKKKYTTKTKNK